MRFFLKNSFLSFFLFVLLSIVLFNLNSCAREQSIPVEANFSIKVIDDDYSVPVKVEITNKTTGADTYEWSFEGANTESSTSNNPGLIIYSEAGNYQLKLKASNKDGNVDEKIIELNVDPAMFVEFDWEMEGSSISPVSLQMVNQSLGATSYSWEFQTATPSVSQDENPSVIFTEPGEHTIKLTISNGLETYSKEKTITIEPAMTIDFDWSVDPIDNDYQTPVILHLNNQSTNAFTYEWIVNEANPSTSTEENPDVTFSSAGVYDITLNATNDKETKTLTKQITILPDQNLLTFTNIELGINTAHGSKGCFFSSELGTVIKQGEVNENNGSMIDFAFFGLNSTFNYNQFVSPDEVQNTAFSSIPNAIHTKIINSQELVGSLLSSSGFNGINHGDDFNSISIVESNTGKTPFDSTILPRVVLFETSDGRKGAIKITSFIENSTSSYIIVDIKVQKHS